MLAALIGGLFIVVLAATSGLAFVVFHRLNDQQQLAVAQSPSAIPCDLLEHTQVHYHAALQILDQGTEVAIPTDVGRPPGCFYWLHMHSGEQGIIHVEAPSGLQFTLGDFFSVWSLSSGMAQPLDATHVSTITLKGAQKIVAYVDLGDGSGPVVYAGNPRSIVLRSAEVITLEVTPPTVSPPPTFTWPPGF